MNKVYRFGVLLVYIHTMRKFFCIALLITSSFLVTAQHAERPSWAYEGVIMANKVDKLPNFAQYTDIKQKKKAFFDFIRPMVKEENQILRNENLKIKELSVDLAEGEKISSSDQKWLEEMATYYRVTPFDIDSQDDFEALIKKVDIIPESLFLAQAANESAWGTSRFAKNANNIFGQWCFTPGCGVVPSSRRADETHEVQKFDTVNDAVRSYMHHLNSHPFYVKLRDSRLSARKANTAPSGYAMAIGLEKYSARGLEYVKEVRSMIRYNKLEVIK